MKIHRESIWHYVQWMQQGRHFSLAGFSDAEWYCVLGERSGERTAFGQTLDPAHGLRLSEVLRRRQGETRWPEPTFVVAVPSVLYQLPSFCDGQVDWYLGQQGIRIEAQERDMITDDLAREGGLFPLVRVIRKLRGVGVVGNPALEGLRRYLPLRDFVPVPSPDCHLVAGAIERAVDRVRRSRHRGLWMVCAGVSAAVIVDQLHGLDGCWFLDCGSIWDAFVGIGEQREWRAELYRDQEKLEAWKRRCLHDQR